jgi:hypothetical protein
MTGSVGRTGSTDLLYRNSNEAQFQTQIGDVLKARTGGQQGSQHHGQGSTGAQGNGAGGPGQTSAGGTPVDYAASAIPLLTPSTQALIDDAQGYDGSGHVDTAESTRRWNAVQNAIAGELRQILPMEDTSSQDANGNGVQPIALRLSGEDQVKFMTFSGLAGGSEPLARETREAFEQLDMEDRTQELDELITKITSIRDKVNAENDDENFIRRGWDGLTGDGAREDLRDYLNGKLDALTDLSNRDDGMKADEYVREFSALMGDFQVQFDKHLDDVDESNSTWNTVGEVGRVVVATAAGIITTAATGNPLLGMGAAFGTYEIIDSGKDAIDAIDGKDIYADGHVGLISAGVDALAGNTSGEEGKLFLKDLALDGISSVGTGAATRGGMYASSLVAGRLGVQQGLGGVGVRVLATTAGGTTGQFVNSLAALGSDATRMGFDGTFSGDAMKDAAITQAKYFGLSIPTSAVSGAIPVFRTLTPKAAGASATGATQAADQFTHRLMWTGVTAQYANDVASGYVGAQWVDGEVSKADAIAAFGSGVPGALQSMVVRPDTQQRVDAWRNGGRDTKLFHVSGYPPSGVALPRIAAEVMALRAVLLAADGGEVGTSTNIANTAAVPASAVRSSLSKMAYWMANARWERAVDMALKGDPNAISLAEKIEKGRGWHGVYRSAQEKAADKARQPGDPATSTTRVNEIRELVRLGEAYRAAYNRLDPARQALLPSELNLRALTQPEDFLTKIQQDPAVPQGTRAALAGFTPGDLLLRYSNVVEGLLTDPEFVVNAIEVLAPKLPAAEVERLRAIYRAQRMLEPDATRGGYSDPQNGVHWSSRPWRTAQGGGPKGIFDEAVERLGQSGRQFEGERTVASQKALADLEGIVKAWQAYAVLAGHMQPGSASTTTQIANARADYRTAVGNLPAEFRGAMPRGDVPSLMPQDQVLAGLRQDETIPEPVRVALANFKPTSGAPADPAPRQTLLTDTAAAWQRQNHDLTSVVEAWQAYTELYSQSRPDAHASDTDRIAAQTAAEADYVAALSAVPVALQGVMPASSGRLATPDEVLANLRGDQTLPQPMRDALAGFKPDTKLLSDPGSFFKLTNDPQLIANQVDQLWQSGKLTQAQYDSIKVVLDVEARLKQDAASGGYNHRVPGVQWNELTWRNVTDSNTGQIIRPGIFEMETPTLDGDAQTFLAAAPRDQQGNLPSDLANLVNVWRAYSNLYSQTQHDLAKSSYKPGLDHKAAEQKPGSSTAPGHPYGFLLKAGAYGIAVNLVVSSALKSTPKTDGFVNDALWAAYGLEAGLALYNLGGQIGYMRALNAKTEFEAKYGHDPALYKPSDDPVASTRYDEKLAAEYKHIEKRRQFWNLIADLGSGVSALRNAAMGAAFASLGLGWVSGMYFANSGLSGAWLTVQRLPVFKNTPRLRTFFRWASIVGGPTLQIAAVILQATLWADEINSRQGGKGNSVAEWFEDWLGDFIDENYDVADLDDDSTPLPDRG